MAGLLLLAVVLPFAIEVIAGSVEIPRNDDWSYRRIALNLATTGRFELDGISETMIIGQVLFAQPFLWLSAFQPSAFAAAGVVFAVGGILGAYAVSRRLLPAREAFLAAATLATFPGYLAFATSFMSDVPSLCAQLLCLGLGAMAVRRRPVHVGWLWASLTIGLFGFSIREFGAAAPVSVIIASLIAERGRVQIWALAVGFAVACLAIHIWRSTLPGQMPPVGPSADTFWQSAQAFSSVSLAIAPAVLVGAFKWRKHLQQADLRIGLEMGGILVAARILQWVVNGGIPPITLTNLASERGVSPRLYLGGYPLLFPDAVWTAVNGLALLLSVAVLAIGTGIAGAHLRRRVRSRALVDRLGSPSGIMFLFCLAVMAGLLWFGVSHPIFDRYPWPLIPPLSALFLYLPKELKAVVAPHRDRRLDLILLTSATLVLLVLATISIAFALNSNSVDAARWNAGERLVDMGLSADEIDAGYEWVGYHATTQGDPTNQTQTETFYRSWWPLFRPCGVVSSEPSAPPGGRMVARTEYALNLVVGPTESLYLYRVESADCP